MTRTPLPSPPTAAPGELSAASAAVAGWLGVALWNAIRIALSPLGPGGFGVRLGHIAIDLGHTLAIGLVTGGLVAAHRWLPARKTGWDVVPVAIAAIGLGQLLLVPDLEGAVERWTDGSGSPLLLRGAALLVSVAVPICFVLGRFATRRRLRHVSAATSLALIGFNDQVLTNGYPGAHFFMAACGATLLGTALCGTSVGASWRRPGSLRNKLVIGALALLCAATVVVPASGRVRVELLQRDTAFLVPWIRGPDRTGVESVVVPTELAPWFRSRRARPDVPPSSFRPLPEHPIVLLVTIDALRMEVLEPEHERTAPNLHEIRKNAVYFSQARSSGSDTRFSLATLFSGRHMSMMKWNFRSRLRPTLENDRVPRLPELLERSDVTAVTGVSLPNMLVPRIGIVRGFSEEFVKDDSDDIGGTEQVVNHAIERLRRHGPEPLFYFTHLIDPHVPYRKHGKRAKTQYDAYLLEVEFVDKHLGRLRRAIRELGLGPRTALIVSSDHGEGFGEHGIYHHNKALYDVMVHVPLMIEIPGISPRTIDRHVSLMDVGPTILNLFGVSVPGFWVSESLVPMLTGNEKPSQRPIFMERPTEQAMLFHDGIKVMLRREPSIEEIYDLRNDPEELDNLREELGNEGDRRVALVRTYAKAHSTGRASSRRSRD